MPFHNIIVNAAFPYPSDDVAVQVATDLAANANGRITLFDVSSDLSWAMQYLAGNWEATIEGITGSKRKRLSALADIASHDGVATTTVLAEGRLSRAIIEQVEAKQHDLVVKVAEQTTKNRSGFIGSTDMRLIHNCPCAVLILKQDEQPSFQKVAVAVDVLDQNDVQRSLDAEAVRVAGELVDRESSLNLVYALPPLESALTIAETDKDVVSAEHLRHWDSQLKNAAHTRLSQLCGSGGTAKANSIVLHGDPDLAIPEFVNSHGVDLLVIGSVDTKGLPGLSIGNTAERILERVACSVLVLKPNSVPNV
ncbi:MAG: universal stress protein [Planctomycetota bacterium]